MSSGMNELPVKIFVFDFDIMKVNVLSSGITSTKAKEV